MLHSNRKKPGRREAGAGPRALWALIALGSALPAESLRADGPRFNREIRPILSENCFPCHGPDSAARKADLRLDQRPAAIAAGAIVPGKPEESKLVLRIFEELERKRMPPPRSRKQLSAAQRELLRRWISTGAEYEPHWSFIPPVRPVP